MFWDSLLPKKKGLIGLDIGSHSIKMVELAEGKKGSYQLKSFGMAQLPPEAISDGNIKDPEAVIAATRNLLANIRPGTKSVATSISGYSVIVKKISLGKATQEALEQSIQWEAEQYIPFDINDVNVDFEILGDSESNPEQMDVMLVAAKKDIIDTYTSLLRSAGLAPAVIDVDSFALGNAFELNYPDMEPDLCVALVDIGAEKMNINIVKDGVPTLTRDASFGGKQITERIQQTRGLSFEQAESVKVSGSSDPELMEAMEEIYLTVLSAWVSEIERSLELFSATYPMEKIGRLVLSGGSSRVPGLTELLASGTGLEVEVCNPFSQVEVDEKLFDPAYLKSIGPQVAIGVGLALRKVGDR